ncbi:hypothetical protein N9C96_01130 [bacterium]|nr:hypothetical protein [bacterium]
MRRLNLKSIFGVPTLVLVMAVSSVTVSANQAQAGDTANILGALAAGAIIGKVVSDRSNRNAVNYRFERPARYYGHKSRRFNRDRAFHRKHHRNLNRSKNFHRYRG